MGKSAAAKRLALAAQPPFIVEIADLTHEGWGVGRRDGKTVFVAGGLPGETVECVYTQRRNRRDEARVTQILNPAPTRVSPACPHFGVCGGCALQHLSAAGQWTIKQRWLLDSLTHIGKVQPDQVLEPLTGPLWNYRRRARLGVKWVAKKGRVLVGFRERHSPYLADLTRCEVLDERVAGLLEPLARLIEGLSLREQIPQIEIAGGDAVMALNLRVLAEPDAASLASLRRFGQVHNVTIYLQPGGPDSVRPLDRDPGPPPLRYRLADFDLELAFQPSHFIQINATINQRLVARACDLLELEPTDRVLDLFCGLGNFSLALARRAQQVIGIEGDAHLVAAARANAQRNGISNAAFYAADLTQPLTGQSWLDQGYTKVLLDPPRSGALDLLPLLATLGAQRLVYVSCHPATLARDVGELVGRFGYRLESAGVLDMFPHTAHVESMAVLVRERKRR